MLLPALALAPMVALPWQAHAATAADQFTTVNVNYVYASTLGFGGYSLAGLDASVYALPLSHSFLLDGAGGTVLRVTLPLQFGVYSFRAAGPDGSRIAIDQQSVALVPEFELQVPVAPDSVLKPFVAAGAAHAFGVSGGTADAWVYAGGLRGVTAQHFGATTLSLGAAAMAAGDSAMGPGFREQYVALEVGAELRHPLGITLGRLTPDAGVYVIAYDYSEPLQFSRYLHPPLQVRNQGEVGVTFGSTTPIGISWLDTARIGAGYVFGDGLRVWHVVFGFPF